MLFPRKRASFSFDFFSSQYENIILIIKTNSTIKDVCKLYSCLGLIPSDRVKERYMLRTMVALPREKA